jgi:predicted transcriptional regulator
MVTVSSTAPKDLDGIDIDELRDACKRLRVTQQDIADEAEVTRPMVVNVFAKRRKSRKVVEAALKLRARAERREAKKAS